MKEKRQTAVALSYDQEKEFAPRIAATGRGLIADTIIEKAKENEIPIMEDASLVEILAKLDINEKIPQELYQAVAEVFAFIYRTDQKMEQTSRN
ncbi:EscU/YscU/HrcU family type III secretion system export apparatus switch protein [Ornithinibacillus contaminans]|uniref:EscU/YscU/HrcU family type III secretion system export apparatus switch protein n=1 Tax=Ornithinibacillus contaminans TaxID=694055 RepID=UPI00064E1480|nr:EscU/YscU/HrcU family type III secretion system export apparatus switch protein [Ornithinibacillus contaminans]